jgi:tetratricopeptide (TPR) repeat protein
MDVDMRRALVVGVVVVASMLGPTSALAQKTNNDYYAGRGTELMRNVEQYHLVPVEPEIRNRDFKHAKSDLDFVLRFFPNHPRGLLLLVELCTEPGGPKCDLDDAFDKAVAVNPRVPGTHVARGIYLARTKRYPEAIKNYEHALELDPDSINAHYNLGLAYIETKQYHLANEHAQRAYELGAPLPGLRDKLKRIGQWDPVATAGGEPHTAPPGELHEPSAK